ncbi:MAG: prephenate dehydrogenase/arogenate dehydrogenase family protein [Acidobacteria bacterium]|nr:MAG: prephenate dehydrogenase/arogenate dehydrogenase family protein [Acidobacteriota bacterium]
MPMGRRLLVVVGGAGRMGQVFVPFFRRRGFSVWVCDPRAPGSVPLEGCATADAVVVCVPLPAMGRVLSEVIDVRPRGLVVEMASVKREILPLVPRARRERVLLASVHPMFGPSTKGTRGRDLILCESGNARALEGARRLFSGGGLKIAKMPLAEHDAWIARTMSVAHLLGLVGASALVDSGTPIEAPDGLSSSTFRRLVDLAGPLLADEPELLYEIQRAAPDGLSPHEGLSRALEGWKRALESGPEAFAAELLRLRAAAAR